VVILELTRRCNLSCLHCGSSCGNSISPDELPFDQWADIIRQLAVINVEKIVFSGGEATTSPHFENLIQFADEIGVRYGFITNGFNLSDDQIDLLKSYPPFAVGVSLDGRAASHNKMRGHPQSYIKAVDALLRLKRAGIKTAVITTLNSFNYPELPYLSSVLQNLCVDAWQIQLAMPMGRMKENDEWLLSVKGEQEQFREICEIIADIRSEHPELMMSAADCFGMDSFGLTKGDWEGCSAGIYTLGIKSNGDVLPCLSLYDDKFICGNVCEKTIAEIWENPDAFAFNSNFDSGQVALSSACVGCRQLDKCRGGCASMSQTFNGHFHDSPFCVDRINELT